MRNWTGAPVVPLGNPELGEGQQGITRTLSDAAENTHIARERVRSPAMQLAYPFSKNGPINRVYSASGRP